ncbi:MAG TPA: hypothetical protein VLA58_11125 [Chitinophagaceae bacterium]|nr:hypothetical protein [Chitinophagaceae bacterium]
MGNLNTKQTVRDLLGQSQLVYRINLDVPQPLGLQKDLVGFGNPRFLHDGNADTNPQNTPSASGMKLSIERSATTAPGVVIGYLVAVDVQHLPIPLPDKFVLIGSFSEPDLSLLSSQGLSGTFAASVVLTYGTNVAGTTVQIKDDTARMNLPGTSSGNSFQYTQAFYSQVVNPGSPHHFNIVLFIERTPQAINGEGFVYAGDALVSNKSFTVNNNVSINTPIKDFRFGLGSANGALYRASVLLHEVEIWFPD